jgi:DNA segregation ATPase FtsK/SpoIIIE-like protein
MPSDFEVSAPSARHVELLRRALEVMDKTASARALVHQLGFPANEIDQQRDALAADIRRELVAYGALDRMAENARELGLDYEPAAQLCQDLIEQELYGKAVQAVQRAGRVGLSMLMRELHIHYNAAARLIDKMEESGVVSRMQPNGERLLIDVGQT